MAQSIISGGKRISWRACRGKNFSSLIPLNAVLKALTFALKDSAAALDDRLL